MNLKEYSLLMSQNNYATLEEALLVMMEDKRVNPHGMLFVNPIDDEDDNRLQQDNFYVATSANITNIPCIDGDLDDFGSHDDMMKDIEMVADEKAYVANVANQIRRKYKIDGIGGWQLTAISPLDNGGTNVCLLVAPEHWEKVKGMVNAYNEQSAANGYGVLTLDDKNMAVTGVFSQKPKEGGFFEKRRIKKQNDAHMNDFMHLIDKVIDHLRRV